MNSKKITSIILSTAILLGGMAPTQANVMAKGNNNTAITKSVNNKVGTVSVKGVLNLRKLPNTSSKIITSFKNNTKVNIIGEQQDWYKVQVGKVTGYVSKKYVKIGNINTTKNNSKKPSNKNTSKKTNISKRTGVVNVKTALNVRKSSNIKSKVVGALKKGTKVNILGEENGWYKIKLNNSVGYVLKTFIK